MHKKTEFALFYIFEKVGYVSNPVFNITLNCLKGTIFVMKWSDTKIFWFMWNIKISNVLSNRYFFHFSRSFSWILINYNVIAFLKFVNVYYLSCYNARQFKKTSFLNKRNKFQLQKPVSLVYTSKIILNKRK